MRAAVFPSAGRLELTDSPRPAAGQSEALVRVGAAGLCAGDLHIFTGKNPYVTYPRIGGHEIAGDVAELGPGTAGPAVGTRVVVDPFIGCGRCYPCRIGKRNCCASLSIVGVHRDGGFADYVIAPVDHLVPIPDGMSAFDAAFAEPVAIGVQACRRAGVGAADRVLVLGAGPIGLAIVEVARARGAEVFASDPDPARLDVAEGLGAQGLRSGDALAQDVLELTSGEGMPVVMEATGVPAVMTATVGLVAAGGRVVIVGLVARGAEVPFPGLELTRKDATILGSRASVDCFPEALGLIASGQVRYPRIATALPLDEAPALFARLARDPRALHKAIFVTEHA